MNRSLIRSFVDRWAAWRAYTGAHRLGFPKETYLYRAGQYGQRMGPTNRVAEEEPDEIPEQMERLMLELREALPKAHLCIEARHRRVIGSMKYRPGCFTEAQIAEACLGLRGESARTSFSRHCRDGYDWLAGQWA